MIQFKEFLDTCQNQLVEVNVYFDDDSYNRREPDCKLTDVRSAKDRFRYRKVDAWYIRDLMLHALLSK